MSERTPAGDAGMTLDEQASLFLAAVRSAAAREGLDPHVGAAIAGEAWALFRRAGLAVECDDPAPVERPRLRLVGGTEAEQ